MVKVTIGDVANKAGVSKSTVSQFLNKRYRYMGEETKKKIEDAIEKLGYHPNYVARSLKQKRTSMVGIIVANIMHRLSTEVSRSIEDFYHKHDIHAIFCNADNDPEKEKKYIEMLRAKQVDGLIIFPTGQNIALYKEMIDENYPVVFMDRRVPGLPVNSVMVNNEEATQEAVNHLVSLGHKRIAIVTQPLVISSRKERVEGYKKALQANSLTINPNFIIVNEIRDLINDLKRTFSESEPPTALIAGNDLVLLEILRFAKEKQLRIPDAFSLIVFDNISFADFVSPSITTIGQPSFEMGEKAAALLLEQINKASDEPPKDFLFKCQLNVRESSIKRIE
ncbi:substrate-binding domain-containing protein [Pullulanibacillus sp. KACC 23026]|uniref:substrate-binding domain-containing protein n=1 Tax=Pullulanibacillus sp. KACC 23026 TaxID=3028315 RepID=UPI0023AEF83B|nr:substrate-binding domain-containing protein [Pullulanibacillus sp. KACC 23026]WEG10788.1 substrate-binding domain-containing protein [Pullulanibacillus sp. KACC 23026]